MITPRWVVPSVVLPYSPKTVGDNALAEVSVRTLGQQTTNQQQPGAPSLAAILNG
jgi:hypothetical protein